MRVVRFLISRILKETQVSPLQCTAKHRWIHAEHVKLTAQSLKFAWSGMERVQNSLKRKSLTRLPPGCAMKDKHFFG